MRNSSAIGNTDLGQLVEIRDQVRGGRIVQWAQQLQISVWSSVPIARAVTPYGSKQQMFLLPKGFPDGKGRERQGGRRHTDSPQGTNTKTTDGSSYHKVPKPTSTTLQSRPDAENDYTRPGEK